MAAAPASISYLVCVDFSSHSDAVIATTARLARAGDHVRLAVVTRPVAGDLPNAEAIAARDHAEAREKLDPYVAKLTDAGLKDIKFDIEAGDPRDILVKIAKTLHPTYIVVGSRGKTGLTGLLLGSVSDYMVRHSHCSVIIAR